MLGNMSVIIMGDVGTPVKYDGSFNRAGFVTMLLINPTIFYPRHLTDVIRLYLKDWFHPDTIDVNL